MITIYNYATTLFLFPPPPAPSTVPIHILLYFARARAQCDSKTLFFSIVSENIWDQVVILNKVLKTSERTFKAFVARIFDNVNFGSYAEKVS